MQSGRIGIVKEEEDKIRQEVLERDNDRCRYCGTTENLEVHHCISKEEQTCHEEAGLKIFPDQIQSEKADQTLRKKMDQPKYRITLCREHHTLTFFNSAVHYLYSVDEKREQRDIDKQIRELSKFRKELQRSWSNQTDINIYQTKKHQIGDKLKKLEHRKMEIVDQGKTRASVIRHQVIRTCEEHLLDVEMKRHKGAKNEIQD
tara:strand:+ start:69 stop:677 length:609 start_codon:yes stop_codon:yes gene_type:complete